MSEHQQSSDNQSLLKKKWWVLLIGATLLVVIGVLGYGYMTARNDLMNQATKGQHEASKLTEKIGVFMQLPNEGATLAVVKDVEKLRGQEFFKSAENDDKVLIFPKSGRALLYRPSTDKVIEYSKVSLNAESAVTP
jgi:hypothetical protein